MVSIADQFAAENTANAIDLLRLESSIRRRILGSLKRLENDLEAKIRRFDLEGVANDATRRQRAERLIVETRQVLSTAYRRTAAELQVELQDVARLALRSTARTFNELFTVDIVSVTLDPATLRALANRTRVLSLPASEYWRSQREGIRRAFTREIRLGVLQGETNEQLVRRIVGQRTGRRVEVRIGNRVRRVPERTGGVMQTSRHNATTLVRTAVQSVSNEAILRTYQENQDVISGVQALVTLDGRTTDICIARSGGAWDLATGAPLPESTRDEQFPGAPPWHWNCRTVLIPITHTWAELMERATGERLKILERVGPETRASIDGEVSGIRDFDDFLRFKGDVFAARKLGPGRFRLWKEGRITLDQLIDQSGRPLSLAELERRFGSAA